MSMLEKLAGGMKEILRYCNVELNGRMTEEQFENWWSVRQPIKLVNRSKPECPIRPLDGQKTFF